MSVFAPDFAKLSDDNPFRVEFPGAMMEFRL